MRIQLKDEQEERIRAIWDRYPEAKTEGGALRREVALATDPKAIGDAALFHALRGYRSGCQVFEGTYLKLVEGLDPSPTGDFRSDLHWALDNIFFALGTMDRPESHQIILKALQEQTNAAVRSHALSGLAFEEQVYDPNVLIPFLTEQPHSEATWHREILSALYALEYRLVSRRRPKFCVRYVLPLTEHPSFQVRWYAASALQHNERFRPVLMKMLEDEHPTVRYAAESGLEFLDFWLAGDE